MLFQQETLLWISILCNYAGAVPLSLRGIDQRTLELKRNDDSYLCSPFIGAKCHATLPCDEAKGKVMCEKGAISLPGNKSLMNKTGVIMAGKCICKPGLCADGHGRCLTGTGARELPDLFKIELSHKPDHYLYMKAGLGYITYQEGDPGPQGHWRVVLNSDNTLMFYTEKWGPDYFMSVEDLVRPSEEMRVEGYREGDWRASYRTLSSPAHSSFEVFSKDRKNIYLQHTRTERWLQVDDLGVGACWGSGRSNTFVFHPPLEGFQITQGAASCNQPALLATLMALFLTF